MEQLLAALPELPWDVVLVYLRVQGFVMVLPVLGERVLPVRLKVGLAAVLAPLLASGEGMPFPDEPGQVIGQAAAELLLGLASGMLLRVLALAIDIATTAIAATASLSQIMGEQNEAAPHPIGNFIHLAGLALLMVMGLPVMLVGLIADSLRIWPPSGWPDADYFLANIVFVVRDSFLLALMLAAPFTIGGFLFQALSGVINRVMPALPVVFIGAPASILLALAGLAVLAPLLVAIWADRVLSFTLPVMP
mgnify:CR=1 FL=1